MIETLCTIGFRKKNLRQFAESLRDAGVEKVVDIRLRNTSQLAGFAKRDDLAFVLGLMDIEYQHVPELAPTGELLDAYRASKDWEAFALGFGRLLEERATLADLDAAADGHANVCLLCSEESAEQCHRRLVAEHVQRERPGVVVRHL